MGRVPISVSEQLRPRVPLLLVARPTPRTRPAQDTFGGAPVPTPRWRSVRGFRPRQPYRPSRCRRADWAPKRAAEWKPRRPVDPESRPSAHPNAGAPGVLTPHDRRASGHSGTRPTQPSGAGALKALRLRDPGASARPGLSFRRRASRRRCWVSAVVNGLGPRGPGSILADSCGEQSANPSAGESPGVDSAPDGPGGATAGLRRDGGAHCPGRIPKRRRERAFVASLVRVGVRHGSGRRSPSRRTGDRSSHQATRAGAPAGAAGTGSPPPGDLPSWGGPWPVGVPGPGTPPGSDTEERAPPCLKGGALSLR